MRVYFKRDHESRYAQILSNLKVFSTKAVIVSILRLSKNPSAYFSFTKSNVVANDRVNQDFELPQSYILINEGNIQ